ncbi:protein FAR1-RELATED SEQUENCE 5-like [Iris pallida]|uniref:Protein FAR1-RELATED SEQUENCE 5-like n=1 Tax=Iris pallida TaxID=29817 RepID=A0AAX6EQD1_IRIPA|nr:protein FAR1-RELATED SEQUENCE 5-like [Iris pallida]
MKTEPSRRSTTEEFAVGRLERHRHAGARRRCSGAYHQAAAVGDRLNRRILPSSTGGDSRLDFCAASVSMSLLGTRVPFRSMNGLSRPPPPPTSDPDDEHPVEPLPRTATPPRRVPVGVAAVHRLAVPRRARICLVELGSTSPRSGAPPERSHPPGLVCLRMLFHLYGPEPEARIELCLKIDLEFSEL